VDQMCSAVNKNPGNRENRIRVEMTENSSHLRTDFTKAHADMSTLHPIIGPMA
jgi:hypothetical protein